MIEATDLMSIAEGYLKSWEHHDLAAMRDYLHPHLHFTEPLSKISSRESFLTFAKTNLQFVKEVRIRSRFQSRNEVALIYDFVFVDPIGTCKTAAHLTFEDAKIRFIELFYDPRHLEKMLAGGRIGVELPT